MSEPNYEREPSYDVSDALALVLLFYDAGDWSKLAPEWLRIAGTREATTKVLCDHVRSALALVEAGRAEEQQRLFHYERIIGDLGKALSFAASVIKSGEPWDEECEQMIGQALRAAEVF